MMAMLASIAVLQGCNKKAEAKDEGTEQAVEMPKETGDATDFFIGLEDVLIENALASIAIIEITDPKENDQHRIRNVRQATMEQLSLMIGIAVREVSVRRVEEVLGDLKGTASTGLNPDDVMDIGVELGVDSLLFASIESKQNDVFFWAYSTMSGDVIFSDTLQKWDLPVNDNNPLGLDLSDLGLGTEGS
jgi:hypothetical protein